MVRAPCARKCFKETYVDIALNVIFDGSENFAEFIWKICSRFMASVKIYVYIYYMCLCTYMAADAPTYVCLHTYNSHNATSCSQEFYCVYLALNDFWEQRFNFTLWHIFALFFTGSELQHCFPLGTSVYVRVYAYVAWIRSIHETVCNRDVVVLRSIDGQLGTNDFFFVLYMDMFHQAVSVDKADKRTVISLISTCHNRNLWSTWMWPIASKHKYSNLSFCKWSVTMKWTSRCVYIVGRNNGAG